jgi:chloramphenicol 3-O phosphotransferase
MAMRIIMLNGGSSSGKSSIARCLQSLLPDPWLTFGVDTLVDAMPPALWGSSAGIAVASDGRITVSPAVQILRSAWTRGLAAIAHAGAPMILDEVFLTGAAAQQQWRIALEGLPILWVGVRCDPDVAVQREAARGNRVPGMAAQQAHLVHQCVVYDMEVDTTHASPQQCAQTIVDRIEHDRAERNVQSA